MCLYHTMDSLGVNSLVIGNTYMVVNAITNRNYGSRIFKGIGYYNMLGFDAGFNATSWEPIENLRVYTAAIPSYIPLDIETAEDIGELKEGSTIVLKDYEEPILYKKINDGDECVLIIHPYGNIFSKERCFVYIAESLKQWFQTGNTTDPQTRIPITQTMLRRFIYRSV